MKKLIFSLLFLALAALPAYAQSNIPTISTNNTLTADDDFVEFVVPSNTPSLTITLTGTFSSTNRVDATSFNADTRWDSGRYISGIPVISAEDNGSDSTQTAVGTWIVGNVGWQRIRVYATDWASGTVTVSAVAGQGGVSSGGGGGSIGSSIDVTFDGDTLILHATNEPTMPFLLPTIAYNADGTPTDFGTLNYHDNAALVSQDGVVDLCKSASGLPTPLTFNTNLTYRHCNTYGDQFVVPALDGVALFPAAAALADTVANPTLTKIGSFVHYLNSAGTWNRWLGYDVPCTAAPQIRSDNTNNDDETQIKATAGVLCGVSARNSHASADAFLRCTNLTAANTTPGSSTIFYEMLIPWGAGFVDGVINETFDTALTCYIATGEAATDATDAALDDITVNIRYR